MIRSRKDCLGGRGCEPSTIPEALHCLIEHAPLEVPELSAALASQFDLHASRSYLYELANAQRVDRGSRGLAIASALTTLTQRPVLLQLLARVNGGEYVQLPAAAEGTHGEARLAAESLREFAEAMQAFADGGADRTWTPEEVERLEREGHDAIESLLRLFAHARRQAGLAALPGKAARMAKSEPVVALGRRATR